MAFWAVVVLGFPFLHWVASQTGIKSIIFNAAQFLFFLTWSIWYVPPNSTGQEHRLMAGLERSGFAWVCMGSMVTDVSPSAEALSLINGAQFLIPP